MSRKWLGVPLLLVLLGTALVATPQLAQGDATGFVHAVEGPGQGQLLDGAGQNFNFRGVQMECWLLGGGPCYGGGSTTETQTFNSLTDLMGQAGADALHARIYNEFITEADMQRVSQLGFNLVRVSINHRSLDTGSQGGWAALDRLLGWADRYGIKVILDMHAAPSPQSKAGNADYSGQPTLWEPGGRQADTVALWHQIAARYSGRTAVAAYDLLNEPNTNGNPDMLIALYRQIIAGIRSVDTNHLVLIQGDNGGYDLTAFLAPLDPNQAYAFHTYNHNGTVTWRQIQYFRAYSMRQGVPILNDEFGLNTDQWVQATRTALENPTYKIHGWVFYNWKDPFRPGSYQDRMNTMHFVEQYVPTPAWNQVIGYVSGVANVTRPTPDQTTQGINEFFQSSAMGNTSEPPATLHALGANGY
jgi:endoglucanase